jgi:CHRD domain
MKSILTLGALAALVLGSVGGAAAQGTMSKGGAMMNHAMVARHMVVKLNAIGGSGESGTATLDQNAGGAGTTVKLMLHGGSAAPQPAHIHVGVCGSNGPIKWPLKSVTAGMSTTVVPAALGVIMSTGAYVNVHKSPKELANIVSCGNIPKMAKGAM